MAEAGLIVQFGTSRFLQAHVDLFAEEARRAGQAVPLIAVVQTSGDAGRAGRVAAMAAPEGYPVHLRGLVKGAPFEAEVRVRSVTRGLSTVTDWADLRDLFARDARWVVSNTGDTGYQVAEDEAVDLGGAAANSFPAKLAQLLHHRFLNGAAPLTVLPCELVNRNGTVLRGLVRGVAARSAPAPGFLDWLDGQVIFANTLVDRIVSEPLQPAGAVAEPYALWAIEGAPGLTLPFTHPSIELVRDLDVPERLKLHILNLGHTCLADLWRRGQRAPGETVRAILDDAGVRARLDAIYRDEVLPGFAAHGLEDAARAYVHTTMARFRNPFLDHRIADIAANHREKVARRIGAFLDWAGTPAPVLAGIVHQQEAGR